CEATFGGLTSFNGEHFHTLASRGLTPEAIEAFREPWIAGAGSYHENLVRGESLVHTDLDANDEVRGAHPQSRAVIDSGARTLLLIALRKDDTLLGSLWFYRKEVRPFSEKQIKLVESFANQAVIAIENARLLNELRQRTDDLTESLDQQTAMSEVLSVVSRSPGELHPVFGTILQNAVRICGAKFGNLWLREDDFFRIGATHGAPAEWSEFL